MHVIAGKAVAFKEALDPSSDISGSSRQNAKAMAATFIERGYKMSQAVRQPSHAGVLIGRE